MATLLEKLRLMQDAQRAKELAQSLLTAGDYMGALDVLEDGRALMRDGNLQAVHALRRLHRQLGEYLELVADFMGASFVNLAAQLEGASGTRVGGGALIAWTGVHPLLPPCTPNQWPLRHTDPEEQEPHTPAAAAAAAPLVASLASPGQQQGRLSESVIAQLVPRVRGLVRLCRLSKVMERYRSRVTDTLKGVVKTVLLEYLDMADYQQQQQQHEWVDEGGEAAAADGNGRGNGTATIAGVLSSPSSNALTAKVRTMPAADFLDCLGLCLEQMVLLMERAALVHAFLEEQISIELSRLLDRRASRSAGASASSSSVGGGATTDATSPSDSSLALSDQQGQPPQPPPPPTAAVPVPLSSPPPTSKSEKFKSFLDKRRMETQGSNASAGGVQVARIGAGGAAMGVRGAMRDEEQIKMLELQACKRLNDEILKTLCDLCQRHVASLLGTWLGKGKRGYLCLHQIW